MVVVLTSIALGGFAAEPERATRTAGKGYELYSWQRSDGAWSYALLFGTNRLKTLEEIDNEATDLRTLKRRLSALAIGEHVVWIPAPNDGSLPDAAIVADLKDYCAWVQIDLHVPQ